MFLKKSDICAELRITIRTLDRWIARGVFPPGRKAERQRIWTQSEFWEWYYSRPRPGEENNG